jgi:hypothetical protein
MEHQKLWIRWKRINGQGWPAPPYGAAALWPISVFPLDSVFLSGNRNFGFHFVQFREYFPCNIYETQKRQKTGTDTVASR